MSLRDKVAQLIIMPISAEPPNTRSATFRKYQHYVRDLRVGGVIVTGYSLNGGLRNAEPYGLAATLNRLQKMARAAAAGRRGFRARRVDARGFHYALALQHGLRRRSGSSPMPPTKAPKRRVMRVPWE